MQHVLIINLPKTDTVPRFGLYSGEKIEQIKTCPAYLLNWI